MSTDSNPTWSDEFEPQPRAMNRIVYPRERLLEDYRALRRQGAGAGMQIAAGLSCARESTNLLVPPSSSAQAAHRRLGLHLADDLAAVANTVPAGMTASRGWK